MMRKDCPVVGEVRFGFTLIEMVVVVWALGICLVVGAMLIVTSLQAERAGENASTRISHRLELGHEFRDDVARARAAPDKLGDLTAGPALLILQMPDQSAIVYRWENDSLERVERTGKTEKRRLAPLGSKQAAVEFVRDPGIITLRITEPSGSGPAKRSDLSAALGGNWR